MKFNKLISKGLALGIILNYTSILSYANTDIPNRYQTLEGEYITIDDSIEGNLEEIEIFGNTVQDENNLEDIQSVGDLYVDKNGNPILDKQGREQYKIDIISGDYFYRNELKNPDLSVHPFSWTVAEDEWNIFTWNLNDYHVSTKDTIFGGSYNYGDKTYIRFDVVKLSDKHYSSSTWCSRIEGYTNAIFDGNFYNNLPVNEVVTASTINTHNAPDSDRRTFRLNFGDYKRDIECKFKIRNVIAINLTKAYGKGNEPTKEWCDKNIQYKNDNNIYWNQSHKTTILLPCQLQKIGNVADRLYWDNSKNRYIIEKNIGEIFITGNETWTLHDTNDNVSSYITKDLIDRNLVSLRWAELICNKFKPRYHINNLEPKYIDTIGLNGYGSLVHIAIDNTVVKTIDEFKNYVKNTIVFFSLEKPEIIETNMTSKLKIPTYDEKTHICVNSENGINPTLKVVVDRLPQIAKEAVAQAENDNNNHNIALARMYINMLPESSYKDQLQEQLSDIFSSDMVLDRETATSNLDVYIKSENILQMSLDTNSISFDDFSGIENVVKENAVNITINSSLPYQINAYLPSEIQNSDKSKTMDKSILNIKENSQSNYQTFANITDKIVLKDNCSSGNYLTHGVDLKLAGGIAHEKDVYKATIKLEAEQK